MSEPAKQTSAYSHPATTLRRYWKGYGGCSELLSSPYLHVAIILSLPGAWWAPGAWPDKVESIVPSLLGLSLAGYAILLALGSGDFFERIRKPKSNGRPSTLEGISTAFLHFIIVQTLALLMALAFPVLVEVAPALRDWLQEQGAVQIYKWLKVGLGFAGWLGLFYSVTCMVALSFRLYRMIQLVCHLPPSEPEKPAS